MHTVAQALGRSVEPHLVPLVCAGAEPSMCLSERGQWRGEAVWDSKAVPHHPPGLQRGSLEAFTTLSRWCHRWCTHRYSLLDPPPLHRGSHPSLQCVHGYEDDGRGVHLSQRERREHAHYCRQRSRVHWPSSLRPVCCGSFHCPRGRAEDQILRSTSHNCSKVVALATVSFCYHHAWLKKCNFCKIEYVEIVDNCYFTS